jgi:hypothetical protein
MRRTLERVQTIPINKAPGAERLMEETTMRVACRWLMLSALAGVALGWLLARPCRGMNDVDAAVYSEELERMQDA